MMRKLAALPHWNSHGCTIVKMPGEIDTANCRVVREELLRLLNAGAPCLILDFTGTMFCDSSAISALVRAQVRAAALRVRLYAAVAPSGIPRRVFEITCLSRLIPIFDDVVSATTAAKEGGPAEPTGAYVS